MKTAAPWELGLSLTEALEPLCGCCWLGECWRPSAHSSLMHWNGVCRAAGKILLMGAFLCFSQDVFPFIRTIEIHLRDSLDSASVNRKMLGWWRQTEEHLLRCFGDGLFSAAAVSPRSSQTSLFSLGSNCRALRCRSLGLAEPLLESQPVAVRPLQVGPAPLLGMFTATQEKLFPVSLVLGIMNSTFQSLGFLYLESKLRYIYCLPTNTLL